MQLIRTGRDGERKVMGAGPISPRITTAPPTMTIAIDGDALSQRDVHRYDVVFNSEDIRFTRDAILRMEQPGPTLRGLARERRALWVVCPMCGRCTKVTAHSLAESIGHDAPIASIASRLRCRKCGHIGATLVPDAIAGDLRR